MDVAYTIKRLHHIYLNSMRQKKIGLNSRPDFLADTIS